MSGAQLKPAELTDDELLLEFRAAALVLSALPGVDVGRSFHLGLKPEALAAVARLPGASVSTTLFRDGSKAYAIDVVRATVDGMTFEAQSPGRALTPEEAQRLEREGREHARLVTA